MQPGTRSAERDSIDWRARRKVPERIQRSRARGQPAAAKHEILRATNQMGQSVSEWKAALSPKRALHCPWTNRIERLGLLMRHLILAALPFIAALACAPEQPGPEQAPNTPPAPRPLLSRCNPPGRLPYPNLRLPPQRRLFPFQPQRRGKQFRRRTRPDRRGEVCRSRRSTGARRMTRTTTHTPSP